MTNVLDDNEYGVRPVANFFGKTVQWLRWAEAHNRFVRADGTVIIPRRTKAPHATAGYRRYTLDDVKEMAESLHRDHDLSKEDYESVLAKIEEEERTWQ
jgi:hypothetical protein